MIIAFQPRREVEPPSAFAVHMSGPFAESGRGIFDAYTPLGGDPPLHFGGFRCVGLDPRAVAVIQGMTRGRVEPSASPSLNRPGYTGVLLVSSEAGLAKALAEKCEPEPGECCIFVDCSDGPGHERCEVIIGERVGLALDSLLRDPGRSVSTPRIGPLLTDLLGSSPNATTDKLRSDGRLTDVSLEQTLPLFGYGLAFYEVLLQIRDVLPRLPAPDLIPTQVETLLQRPLDQLVGRLLNRDEQVRYADDDGTGDRSAVLDFDAGAFSLAEPAMVALGGLFQPLRSAWSMLPDAPWALQLLFDELALNYDESRPLTQAKANLIFQQSLLSTVLSMQGLGQVLRDNALAVEKHGQLLFDLARSASIFGITSFGLGTIYGVLYDIVDTFVQIIRYSFAGIRWMFYQGKAALTSALSEPPCPPASDETVAAWFPIFDLDHFFAEDLPELYRSAKTLSYAIRDDFIENASKYGEMVGQYILSALGSTLETTLTLAFDPYDPEAGYLDRIYYLIKQWFYLGSVLGPIIVDIVLTFCTAGGGGVAAAALKLGKLEHLKDAFRVTTVGTKAVEGFALFQRISDLFPNDLARVGKVVSRVLARVWQSIGPIRDQLLNVLESARKRVADLDLEWWAAQIDQMYERASNINFLVGMFLLITGNTEVDAEGATREEPA